MVTSSFHGPGVAALQSWSGQLAAYGANQTVVDKVPADMLHMVDAHWYQFPPINPLWHALLGFSIAVLGFISVIGNGMVIYIFMNTKSLKTPSNLLVVNLAFSDFLMMCAMSPAMVINCYNETWVFGPFACELYGCAGSLFGCASIWSMTMIAFDRYNVIVKGIAARPMTNNGAIKRLAGIWLFSLMWTLAPFFGWNRYVPEGNMTACGTDYLTKDWFSRSYILIYSIFVYFLPLLLIIYSYFFIVQAVAAHEKAMREQAKKMNVASLRSSEAANTNAECKLAKVALMTIALWFMAWTPYLVINFTGVFESAPISPLATIWGSLFAKANAVYNPIVYGISHPKYRAALYKRFPVLSCQLSPEEDGSVASVTTTVTEEKPAFDRYNVIVKGIAARPMTNNGAIKRLAGIWLFSLMWTLAPFFGWNRYVPEGNMTACGTDYLTKDWFSRSYILIYSIFVYFLPLLLIIYSYFFIVQAVAAHEKAMREQAKKMNVASLRSSEAANTNAECKLAKVALMTIALWFMAWTPYLVINFTGVFESAPISPLATIWGSLFAKANAVYNPIVYGISHPKYRAALYKRFPVLSCQLSPEEDGSVASVTTTVTEEKPAA